jgi:hypothetical protein
MTSKNFSLGGFWKNGKLKMLRSPLKNKYNRLTNQTNHFRLQEHQVWAQYLVFQIQNSQRLLYLLNDSYQEQKQKVKHILVKTKCQVRV